MIFLLLVIVLIGLSAGLYALLSSLDGRKIWKAAAVLSLVIAVIRTSLSVVGRLILESDFGWLQLPAFAMALVTLPEAALVSTRLDTSVASIVLLGLVTLAGTGIWVFTVAAIASLRSGVTPGT